MPAHSTDILQRITGRKVLIVGDVMLDSYLWGRVDRISPEAPVPVVHVTSRSARLGGAANVALNVKALGASPVVISVVGDDANADRLFALFEQQGLSTEGLIRSRSRMTTVKTRVISGHQHVVRVDEEQEDELDEDDRSAIIQLAQRLLGGRPSVLIMEDYNKGVLTPAVISALISMCASAGIPTAVDPKKRNFFCYSGVDLFKPNLKELSEGLKVDLAPGDPESVRNAVQLLEQRLGNRISMITMSEHGVYIHGDGREEIIPAHVRKIADVSGAGDTVIAVAALALAAGADIHDIAQLANLAGGLVCEEVGVVPIDPVRLNAEIALLTTT